MKLYVLDKHNVSIMDKGVVRTYKPFIIAQDEDSSLFEKSGYVLIDTLFNINDLREISNKIESIYCDVDKKLLDSMSELEILKTDIKSFCDYGSKLKDNLAKIEEVKLYADNFFQQIDKDKSLIEEKFKELENKLNSKEEDFNKQLDLKEADLNNLLILIEKAEKEISERIKSQYDLMKQEMTDFYNLFKAEADSILQEMKRLSDLSRKWAVNPINVPVEQGKYSARHYALKIIGENK